MSRIDFGVAGVHDLTQLHVRRLELGHMDTQFGRLLPSRIRSGLQLAHRVFDLRGVVSPKHGPELAGVCHECPCDSEGRGSGVRS